MSPRSEGLKNVIREVVKSPALQGWMIQEVERLERRISELDREVVEKIFEIRRYEEELEREEA